MAELNQHQGDLKETRTDVVFNKVLSSPSAVIYKTLMLVKSRSYKTLMLVKYRSYKLNQGLQKSQT